MDLQQPTSKMSKSLDSPQGTVLMSDDPKAIEKKFKRAVTDSDAEVRYDVAAKPGVSNLLSILGAATGRDPKELAQSYSQYGALKADAAAAVIELLAPIQQRQGELAADPAETARLLGIGADKARTIASVGARPSHDQHRSPTRLIHPSAATSSSPAVRGMLHCSAGRWCSSDHATTNGSLPARRNMSAPISP